MVLMPLQIVDVALEDILQSMKAKMICLAVLSALDPIAYRPLKGCWNSHAPRLSNGKLPDGQQPFPRQVGFWLIRQAGGFQGF